MWGQIVAAVLVVEEGTIDGKWTPISLRRALTQRLARHQMPRTVKVVGQIPRNAMGKGKVKFYSAI